MKFSQLALIAVVSADATPKCSVTANPTVATDLKCTCDVKAPETCLTTTNKKKYEAFVKGLPAEMKAKATTATKAATTPALKKALKTEEASAHKDAAKLTATAKIAWDKCSAAATKTATTDKKPVIINDACETDLVAYLDAEATEKATKAVVSSNGAVIGIIVGCCVGALLIGGCALWYCRYKKKKADGAFNHDDLYEAFVDNDQA
jgi:hypothetical protein